ncbi:MAG: hypothetical protein LBL50_05505 [Candidatus Margulisbacteria bacterium]|nr:hypothetical protein [Candidatus Margulisiibacteriota bacterium]
MRKLVVLTEDDIHSLEIAANKVFCAYQVLRPDAVPPYAPKAAADKFFREAIFAYADAQYLRDNFWLGLARQYGIAEKDMSKLYVDFHTNELLIKD